MTIETIIDHDQPDFEPGNPAWREPGPRAGQRRLIKPSTPRSHCPYGVRRPSSFLAVEEQAAITVRSWNHERSHADF